MTKLKKAKYQNERERILQVALKLFKEKSYEHSTMRDIAKACEIGLGTA